MSGINNMLRLFHLPFVRLTAMALWLCGLPAGAAAQDLMFEDAWIRAVPPGMGMTAGFGTVRNASSADIEIKAFASPEFGEVTLHRTEQSEGMSRMREIPSLQVPAASEVELAPGGYHLMLMQPLADLRDGQIVTLEMTAAEGRIYRFEVPVRRR